MIIQGLNSITSAYGASSKSVVERKTSPAPAVDFFDKVTLSSEAKTLAANETGATQTRTNAQERMLQEARSDPATAAKMADSYAKGDSFICYDIRGQPGAPPLPGGGKVEAGVMKLASTGEIVGEDFVAKFNRTSGAIDAQRRTIYETETRKGTEPVEILSKMIDFTNRQSQDYLKATQPPP